MPIYRRAPSGYTDPLNSTRAVLGLALAAVASASFAQAAPAAGAAIHGLAVLRGHGFSSP